MTFEVLMCVLYNTCLLFFFLSCLNENSYLCINYICISIWIFRFVRHGFKAKRKKNRTKRKEKKIEIVHYQWANAKMCSLPMLKTNSKKTKTIYMHSTSDKKRMILMKTQLNLRQSFQSLALHKRYNLIIINY